MNTLVDDVVAFCRMFAMLERDQVCCGFVERHHDPDDGRRWLIELTASGTKEARQLASMTENAVALIMSRMPKDMRKPAIAMIADLRKAAEEVRDQIDCC